MALTVGTTTANSALTFSHVVAAGTELLVVTATSRLNTGFNSVTGITFNGTPLTLSKSGSTGQIGQEIWHLLNPTATTANVVVTYSGTNDGQEHSATNISGGVDKNNPIGTTGASSNVGDDGVGSHTKTASVSPTPTAPTGLFLATIQNFDNPTYTATSVTALYNNANIAITIYASAGWVAHTGSATAISWSASYPTNSNSSTIVYVEVQSSTKLPNTSDTVTVTEFVDVIVGGRRTLSVFDTVTVTDLIGIPYKFTTSDTVTVTENVSLLIEFVSIVDFALNLVTSSYKWLTQTLLTAQQGFALRPYFTAQVIDDTIQPNAQLFSGAGTPAGNGSMAVAPDGTAFAVGLDGSNNLKVYRETDLNAVGGVYSSSTALVTTGDNFLDSRNNYSISISDYYNGKYRICVWYFSNFVSSSSRLRMVLQYSDDGGLTFTKVNFSSISNLPQSNSVLNISCAAFKPVLSSDGTMKMGCFYINQNTASLPNSNVGYDINYAWGDTTNGYTYDKMWYQNANSYDWTIHSISAFYLNGIQYCVFSGFRNIIDSPGTNLNYSIWVTALLNNIGLLYFLGARDLWMAPVSVMPVGSASNTNKNSFTYPSASVYNSMVYITMNAVIVDSISQTSQGSNAQTVTTHTNYMMIQSDNGTGFSYPSVFVGTDGTEFNNSTYASFALQNGYWYLGCASGWLWQYIQNNIVADVSGDIIGFNIQESAGQPSSISLNIANANNKWVGAAPTGAGAAAIAKNRKIALWQGYYNASVTPEVVPHSVYYIDDIVQTVTSTKNDVTLVGRDLYKKLKTTITKFSYQFTGSAFFTDIFDGTFLSSWNQISGSWSFLNTITPPLLELNVGSGGDDVIAVIGSNGNSYGHLMRVFMRSSGGGTGHIYGLYINASNWLRLELNCSDGQSWAVVKNVNGTPTTILNGTLPFVMSSGSYYGVYVRRYDYLKFSFMIDNGGGTGNTIANYSPATTSYICGGSGEFDVSSTFQSSSTWQSSFTVGFGRGGSGPIDWRAFMFTSYNNSNNLGSVIRKIARIAGIFSFKLSYTWKELFFSPNLTGTYTITNRKLVIGTSNKAISNTNTFGNGEISFRAKLTIPDDNLTAGFKFVFRADNTTPTNAYYFHIIKDNTGVTPFGTFCRFERVVASAGTTIIFYNTGYDVNNNTKTVGSLNLDLTQWHTYKLVAIDGWFYAFVDETMVASWNDNNFSEDYLTTGKWGFIVDANATLQVQQVTAPDFWKPIPVFSLNPGDDMESAIESLLASLRAWMFSDLLGRFKSIFLHSTDASTYTYNSQLFQQNVDNSDKEYVTQVTVYGNGVAATARNTNLMPGVQTRDIVLVDYTINTQQDAQTRASNELINRNQYQNQYTPKQFINVGAEIFDTVTITNTGNNTSGVNVTTRVYSQAFEEGGGNNTSDYSLSLDTGNV